MKITSMKFKSCKLVVVAFYRFKKNPKFVILRFFLGMQQIDEFFNLVFSLFGSLNAKKSGKSLQKSQKKFAKKSEKVCKKVRKKSEKRLGKVRKKNFESWWTSCPTFLS